MSFIRNIAIKGLAKIVGQTGENSFFMPFGSFGLLGNRSNKKIYEESAILSAVINKRAQCFGNSVLYIKDKQGNEPDTLQAKRLRNLLDAPNPLMSWEQLYRATDTYRMLYGHCVWLKLSAFENDMPSSLYIINPEQLQIDFDKSCPIIGKNTFRKIRIGGKDTALTLDDLIIFNDTRVDFGGNPFLAQSRMKALSNESNLLRVIADAEMSIIRNRGAIGILAKDAKDGSSVGVFDDSITAVQEQYRRYGISSDQWNIIITSAALKWYSIAQPLKDLMLIEFEEQMAKKICAVFDIPYALFPFAKDSALGNGGMSEKAELQLYQNTVIPLSKSDAKILTASLCKGTGLAITMDYSDMWIFQEDMKQKAESANVAITAFNSAQAAGNITREEWRALIAEYINIDPSAALLEHKVPRTQLLGVGGLQALKDIVIDPNLTDGQKRALLVNLFEFTLEEALQTVPEVEVKPVNITGNV
jgi:hypothetical protein